MQKLLVALIVVLIVTGCKSDASNPIAAPSFNPPKIVSAAQQSEPILVSFSIASNMKVVLWIIKGIGMGEENDPLEGIGQAQCFVSNALPVRLLMDKVCSPGTYQLIWDTRDESGQLVPAGYYRIYITAGSFYRYRDIQLLR